MKARLYDFIICECLNIKPEDRLHARTSIIFYIIEDPAIWTSGNVLMSCNTALILHSDTSLHFAVMTFGTKIHGWSDTVDWRNWTKKSFFFQLFGTFLFFFFNTANICTLSEDESSYCFSTLFPAEWPSATALALETQKSSKIPDILQKIHNTSTAFRTIWSINVLVKCQVQTICILYSFIAKTNHLWSYTEQSISLDTCTGG